MELKEIENAINELIKKATEGGGFVWIVDKRRNNFALRLDDPVTLTAYIPDNELTEGEQ